MKDVQSEAAKGRGGVGEMRKRRAKMEDGRYLIYYTFGDEAEAPRAEEVDGAEEKPGPEAVPVAEEERRV